MKKIIFIMILISSTLLFGYTKYEYGYDAAGNRISRVISYFKEAEPQEQILNTYTIKVFPNPVQNYFSIDISGINQENKVIIDMVEFKGSVIYHNDNFQSPLKIDMTDKTSGAYLLNIYIDGKPSYWKIIKEN